MSTFLILVLVLAALVCMLAGILIGRYYVPDDRMLRRSAKHARSYIRTATLALAGDHDGAFDELREVVIADNIADTEPYFALGALLRARGQWAQAVRVHESLRLRQGLTRKEYLRTTYELGLDYFHAGMPRRAIAAMEQCLSQDSKHEGALRALCRLYEVTGRYADAARCFRELRRIGKGLKEHEEALVHHLLCAAARAAIPDDLDAAKRHLREAQKSEHASEHALVIAAELAMARRDGSEAIAALREALARRPDLAPHLVPMLTSALTAQQDGNLDTAKAAVDILWSVRESIPPSGYLDLAIAELRSLYDGVAALEEYRQAAAAYPDLLAAHVATARLALAENDTGGIRRELDALAGPEGVLSWALAGTWRCGACGHRETSLFWRCSQCESWGTVCRDVGTMVREVAAGAPGPASLHQAQPQALLRSMPQVLPRALPRGGVDLALLGAKHAREDSAPSVRAAAHTAPLAAMPAQGVLARVKSWFRTEPEPAMPPAAAASALSSTSIAPRATAATADEVTDPEPRPRPSTADSSV